MIIAKADPINVHLSLDWLGAKVLYKALQLFNPSCSETISNALKVDGYDLTPAEISSTIGQYTSILRPTAGSLKNVPAIHGDDAPRLQ